MGLITNKIYICLPFEKEVDKIDWDGLSTEEYNSKTYYKIPSGVSSSDVVKKITFETLKDNVTVTLNIVSSSEQNFDFAYACELDGTSGYYNAKYKISGDNKSITCEYVVQTKGAHWIYIGYRKDFSGNHYNDCGYFFIDNSDKEYSIRQPKEVYLASDKMKEITYGSKKILERGLGNTISWETLTWDKSNNSYTYNTKGKLYMSYNYNNVYLTNSPASIATRPYQLGFNNINTYYGTSYTCTYKLDLSDLDTSNINNMENMFFRCGALTSVNVANLDTSKVTNMKWMFLWCNSLSNLDVSRWNTSNVTDTSRMFEECFLLSNIDVSRWNTSKMNNVAGMFNGCKSLTSLDLSGWDTTNISTVWDSNRGGTGLFMNCENLVDLKLPKNFITSKVTDISDMFNECKKLTSLDLSGWDTSNITKMNNLFKNSGIKIIDISNWDLSKLYLNYGFKDVFFGSQCETIKLPNMNKYGVDTTSYRFYDLNNLKSFYAPELVNIHITDISRIFKSDINLAILDTTDWDCTNVSNASLIFYKCESLTTLIYGHESEPDVVALKNLKVSFDLKYCHKLNYESVYALFRGLATITTTKTITLPKVMEGKLDADKVKIATDKGWTIDYVEI